MNTPRGMAIAGAGRAIFVADFKRILVVDRSLCRARELPLSAVCTGLKQPYAISFDETRARLYVVERSRGRIMVFDNVFADDCVALTKLCDGADDEKASTNADRGAGVKSQQTPGDGTTPAASVEASGVTAESDNTSSSDRATIL